MDITKLFSGDVLQWTLGVIAGIITTVLASYVKRKETSTEKQGDKLLKQLDWEEKLRQDFTIRVYEESERIRDKLFSQISTFEVKIERLNEDLKQYQVKNIELIAQVEQLKIDCKRASLQYEELTLRYERLKDEYERLQRQVSNTNPATP